MKHDMDFKMSQAKKHGVCKICLKVASHKETECDGKYKTYLVCKCADNVQYISHYTHYKPPPPVFS